MKLSATPKTLRQAIINGFVESFRIGSAEVIERHVADFIRQKLTPIYGRATMEGNQDVIKAIEKLQKELGI